MTRGRETQRTIRRLATERVTRGELPNRRRIDPRGPLKFCDSDLFGTGNPPNHGVAGKTYTRSGKGQFVGELR